MRKTVLCALIAALLLANCFKKKDDCSPRNIVAPLAEQTALADYITSNNIVATRHESGLYYKIIQEGTGVNPAICSSVKVGYKGTLTNGTVAEEVPQMVLNLKVMLEAWRISLPLIKPGGRIMIYAPPSLAYGTEGKKVDSSMVVPSQSIIIYDIELYEVL